MTSKHASRINKMEEKWRLSKIKDAGTLLAELIEPRCEYGSHSTLSCDNEKCSSCVRKKMGLPPKEIDYSETRRKEIFNQLDKLYLEYR